MPLHKWSITWCSYFLCQLSQFAFLLYTHSCHCCYQQWFTSCSCILMVSGYDNDYFIDNIFYKIASALSIWTLHTCLSYCYTVGSGSSCGVTIVHIFTSGPQKYLLGFVSSAKLNQKSTYPCTNSSLDTSPLVFASTELKATIVHGLPCSLTLNSSLLMKPS